MELSEIIDLMWDMQLIVDTGLTYNNDKGLLDDRIDKIERKYREFNIFFKEKIDMGQLLKNTGYRTLPYKDPFNGKEGTAVIADSASILNRPPVAFVLENRISFGGENRTLFGYEAVNLIEHYLKSEIKDNEKGDLIVS